MNDSDDEIRLIGKGDMVFSNRESSPDLIHEINKQLQRCGNSAEPHCYRIT